MIEGTRNDYHPLFGRLTIWTNEKDKSDFTMAFGEDVGMFDENGFVRSILGQNKYPVFNSNPAHPTLAYGAVVPMTPEQQAEKPTWDYRGPIPPPPTV